MMGKTMASVMGPVKAKFYEGLNNNILRNFADLEEKGLPDSREQARESHIHTFEGENDSIEVIKSDHIPLRGDRDHPPGVLMVLSDITELTQERRRSEHMTRQLINTIVNVVDRRDPYSIEHSARVAEVSKAIAKEMELSDEDLKTVDLAGNLLSLGKIFVPTAVLAKGEEDMTPQEHEVITRAYLVSADLLKGVPFDGPVVETIRQSGERVDGAGPYKLKGDNILMTARIVAVANMFVRKVTARAYREGLTFEEVSTFLLQNSGTIFDRKPVSALINYLDNHGGMEKWAHFRSAPQNGKSDRG
jgi:HD-GYP domain-containing protein (c-di-GMP phosphodiesterase class II)